MKSPEELNPAGQESRPTVEAIIENPDLLPQEQKERAEFGVKRLEIYDRISKLFKENIAARGTQFNPFDHEVWREYLRFVSSDKEVAEIQSHFELYITSNLNPQIKKLEQSTIIDYLKKMVNEGYFLHEIGLAGIELAEQAGLVMMSEKNTFKDYLMPTYSSSNVCPGNIYNRISRIKAFDKISEIPEERRMAIFNFLDKVCTFGIMGIGRGFGTDFGFTPSEIETLIAQTADIPEKEFDKLAYRYSSITHAIQSAKDGHPEQREGFPTSSDSTGIQILDDRLERLRTTATFNEDEFTAVGINHGLSAWGLNPFRINSRQELVHELASELQKTRL